MKVSFAHANLAHGNESTLLRFDSPAFDRTPCLLIDAGQGVDVDSMLTEGEYLAGILLTHAHQDHYLSLGHNLRDDAAVYAAPGTARVLATVLADGSQYEQLGDTNEVVARLEAIDSWTQLHETVRIRPIPAGHAPGAAGFVIQFLDDGEWQTILVSGDFTLTRVAGYPAFPDDLLLDIEAMVLTGATSERDDRTEMLQTTVERSVAGSCVLLTATGLSCVEYAYLLGHICDRLNHPVDITITGQAAKLYDRLGYDVPNVQSVPEFESTTEVLSSGEVTIAGPQVPTEGASGRLFDSLCDSGTATLVQVTDGATHPIESAGCTTYAFDHIAHPTEDEIDMLVDAYDPASIFVTHQHGQQLDRYKDKYASFVWATEDSDTHLVYDGCWQSPPWLSGAGRNHVMSSTIDGGLQQQIVGNPPMPALSRTTDVDFAAEGLDISNVGPFRQKIHAQHNR